MEENDPPVRTSSALKRIIQLTTMLSDIWGMLGVVLILTGVVEASLTLYYQISDNADLRHALKAAASSGVYGSSRLGEEYLKELVDAVDWPLPMAVYTQTREPDYTGKFINVHDGIRRTWNYEPSNSAKSRLNIYFFGGSTLWGWGSRDDFTIPSLVAKRLSQRGISAQVTNYAVNGDVSTQSLIRFIFELRKKNVPDLVIFYGGLVDALSACTEGRPGLPLDRPDLEGKSSRTASVRVGINLQNFALMRLLTQNAQLAGCSENLEMRSHGAAEVYLANIRFIKSISASLFVKALFYFEPQLTDKTHVTRYEEDQIVKFEVRRPGANDLYSRMRRKLVDKNHQSVEKGVIHDLRTIFSDATGPIYMDGGHYGEEGNEIISRKITADILELYAPVN
ncbi:SGNH/GDSL hydrolase family protein [Mesorhizobium sp. M1121]|uniref:SGNH/GDSL hydrolase family protein n=1 Tax=Mesorhizobium sp. M1121 TaxID=2957058 RepID=UPI00333C2443